MGRVVGSGPLGKRRREGGGGERTQGCRPMYVTAKQRRVAGLNEEEGGEGSTSSAATTKWSSGDDLASSPDCALVTQITGDGNQSGKRSGQHQVKRRGVRCVFRKQYGHGAVRCGAGAGDGVLAASVNNRRASAKKQRGTPLPDQSVGGPTAKQQFRGQPVAFARSCC